MQLSYCGGLVFSAVSKQIFTSKHSLFQLFGDLEFACFYSALNLNFPECSPSSRQIVDRMLPIVRQIFGKFGRCQMGSNWINLRNEI